MRDSSARRSADVQQQRFVATRSCIPRKQSAVALPPRVCVAPHARLNRRHCSSNWKPALHSTLCKGNSVRGLATDHLLMLAPLSPPLLLPTSPALLHSSSRNKPSSSFASQSKILNSGLHPSPQHAHSRHHLPESADCTRRSLLERRQSLGNRRGRSCTRLMAVTAGKPWPALPSQLMLPLRQQQKKQTQSIPMICRQRVCLGPMGSRLNRRRAYLH